MIIDGDGHVAEPMSPMESPFRAEDREAIRMLIAAYAHLYDDGRIDEFSKLFAENGRLQLGPGGRLAEGPEDIREALVNVDTRGLRHFTTDVLIEFTGDDRATATSRFAVHSPKANFDGTYHDEFAKGLAGWRFTQRAISVFEN
jgi:hypothetical protein